ncbi:PREDICTED: succinate--hydroxymethylglutarate CoA-transferase isoform X2 [Nanorana parkeri]|uniref:succinate--hydroxymethylglutarate CoA-transferase isoform X2 n=1 Tax=Nanorana parkeri TaxID=125878 RepID=UPI000854E266|nr:PREDICTED: succinate--hydroxymethylglutarate CoA-transferase isoform X2 [Nanorana parkeri]
MYVAARLMEALRRSNIGARRCGASPFITSPFSQRRGVFQRVTEADNVRPLEGVKILDLTRVLAGPFATMILGDLGAEVIKVEKPGSGDDTRSWGPPFVGTESTYFLSVNRNKKSIAVNMKDPKGTKIIKDITQACDVLIENYIPGKLAEMGLGYEDVKKTAPHIIYCSITGYGQSGPLFKRAGYDAVACAMSGLMHITGPEDGDPVRPGVAMTDLATGLYAHGAILAGLLQKSKTGKGMHIDCNLLSSQVACLTHVAANFLNGGVEAKRWGTAHGSIVPYQSFKAKDGYVVIGAGNDQQFSTVCKILNLPELISDPRFKTNKLRVQYRKYILEILTTRFSEKTTSEWLQLFEGSGIPYGPINSIKQVFSEPQVAHNGLILEMDHPTAGKISVPGPAVRFNSFNSSAPVPPPVLGQHTVEVLKTLLGYEDGYIAELIQAKTISENTGN